MVTGIHKSGAENAPGTARAAGGHGHAPVCGGMRCSRRRHSRPQACHEQAAAQWESALDNTFRAAARHTASAAAQQQ
ncbi:MAG: hypothetical protein LBG81_00440 [Coriobacteriaceae bacterium]|jgi:hypothetical protein|nr:hypothetical protein [Coriobacteriaceae bacterium]